MKAGVVGASGFMGGELVRLIDAHPQMELAMVCGGESAGKKLRDVRPGLATDLVVQSPDAATLAENCDVVFLALPHGQSAPLAEELLKREKLVIDLGSDFRLKDPADVEKYYSREAPRQKLLDIAWYGQPELLGSPPANTRLIACPGCFATALCLGLAPIGDQEMANVFGATGSSGSGIQPQMGVHHSLRTTGFTAYKPLKHQHLGEVDQLLRSRGSQLKYNFVPHSAPMVRGIHLTIIAETSADQTLKAAQNLYKDTKLVNVKSGPVNLGSVIGTCRVEIGIDGNETTSVITVAIDNLLKGGSGQAIQNFNLLMGWPETEGLPLHALYP